MSVVKIAVAYGPPGTEGRKGWNWCDAGEMLHTGVPVRLPLWRFPPVGIERSFVGCLTCKGSTHAMVREVEEREFVERMRMFRARLCTAWPYPWWEVRGGIEKAFERFGEDLAKLKAGTVLTIQKGEGWSYKLKRV